jgi:hypothetical protein
VSTGKKVSGPNFFSLSGQNQLSPVRSALQRGIRTRHFVLLIPDQCRCIHSEAIRSVTHLALALYGR